MIESDCVDIIVIILIMKYFKLSSSAHNTPDYSQFAVPFWDNPLHISHPHLPVQEYIFARLIIFIKQANEWNHSDINGP